MRRLVNMRRLRLALLIALASMPALAQPNLQTGIPFTVIGMPVCRLGWASAGIDASAMSRASRSLRMLTRRRMAFDFLTLHRSEERRVGKVCRHLGASYPVT